MAKHLQHLLGDIDMVLSHGASLDAMEGEGQAVGQAAGDVGPHQVGLSIALEAGEVDRVEELPLVELDPQADLTEQVVGAEVEVEELPAQALGLAVAEAGGQGAVVGGGGHKGPPYFRRRSNTQVILG